MSNPTFNKAREIFSGHPLGQTPAGLRAVADAGLATSRQAYGKMSEVVAGQAMALGGVVEVVQASARTIGEKVIENTLANTEAALDAASSMARTRSVPEALRVQAEFMQKQMASAGVQGQELLDLSTKVTTQALESISVATARSFEQLKGSGTK